MNCMIFDYHIVVAHESISPGSLQDQFSYLSKFKQKLLGWIERSETECNSLLHYDIEVLPVACCHVGRYYI